MSVGADELVLYADNTGELYPLKRKMFSNLASKKARGSYHRQTAARWLGNLFGKAAAMRYEKEIAKHQAADDPRMRQPWNKLFTPYDRADAGLIWASEFERMYAAGELGGESTKPRAPSPKTGTGTTRRTGSSTQHGRADPQHSPHNSSHCPVGMKVQTLLFPASWPEEQIRAFLLRHDFRMEKLEKRGKHVRVRQRPPSAFRPGSFRTIRFGHEGVQAVVGCPK